MKGSQFLTRQTVNLRGTQWETPKRKSYSATIRPSDSGGFVAKICGAVVNVMQRGKSWVIQQ
jgi:hypothetical protein